MIYYTYPGSPTTMFYKLVSEFHHYFSRDLSSSKRNHIFLNGGNNFQGISFGLLMAEIPNNHPPGIFKNPK